MPSKAGKPCAPMRADEDSPRLREFLRRCWRCGGHLTRSDCLAVVVRIAQWLERASPALARRIQTHLAAKP